MVHDGSMQSIARTVLEQLNPQSKFAVEYCNEVWNSGGIVPTFEYASIMGDSLMGLTLGDAEDEYSYSAYRSKQLFDDVASVWGARNPRFYGIMATHYFSGEPSTDEKFYTGHSLCGTSCGNSTYQANIGTDYNSSPNRPIDEANAISGAPYLTGSACNYFGSIAWKFSAAMNSMVPAVDDYVGGNTSAAYAYLVRDITGGPDQSATPTTGTGYIVGTTLTATAAKGFIAFNDYVRGTGVRASPPTKINGWFYNGGAPDRAELELTTFGPSN